MSHSAARDFIDRLDPSVLARALPLFERVAAMVARGKERRITIALDQAHASLDETLAERIKRGEGHQ